MGYLFKIFLIALGLYYLFKLIGGNKKESSRNREQRANKNQTHRPNQHTDNTQKSEGEYVDYEEID